MQHRLMTDCHILDQGEWITHVSVQHAAFLHIAVFADMNQFIVAPKRCAKPHIGTGIEFDFADQCRGLGDPGICGDLGDMVAQLVYRHGD